MQVPYKRGYPSWKEKKYKRFYDLQDSPFSEKSVAVDYSWEEGMGVGEMGERGSPALATTTQEQVYPGYRNINEDKRYFLAWDLS